MPPVVSARDPFAPGSVSLRLYPHPLPAAELVAELLHQGRLAERAGFAGVMVSEHHGGFPGYIPNPLQVAGWLLDETTSVWAAACPLLAPLRPAGLIAEEVAWLAARHPGRVGVGLAAGAWEDDFTVAGVPFERETLAARFRAALAVVAGALGAGKAEGPLAGDQAVQRCAEHPVPVVSAAASPTACRRAAELGCGIILDSMGTAERTRRLVDAYLEAGGAGPRIAVRRAWVGEPPVEEIARQLAIYRSYAPAGAQDHWSGGADHVGMVVSPDAVEVAGRLRAFLAETGCDVLNVRVHVAGLEPTVVREQILAMGDCLRST
jgi:alkanesulfonate monooxygenase SsuD/methylene tetrahydromethanopterin reductase-like flavin-dependent oxidoreductase (luciferase family)